MKEIKITNMLEGAAIFESVASGNLTSKYGEVKSIRITQPDAYGEHKGYYTLTVNESNNYKEEGMNKTVRDAVIEFKGVACAGCFIEAIGIAPDIIPPRYIGQIVDGGLGFDGKYYRLVCTKSEFNTYVDSLSHHAGKELFQQYLAADKTLLEKEAKVDYTSCKLKWSGQDELIVCTSTNGETGCWVSGSEYIIKKSLKGDYVTDEFGRRRFVGEHVGALFTSTPQPKPAFTQEMCDNGELPSVGMECMILFDNDSEPEWHEITWYGLFNGNPSFLCKGKQCWPERGGEFHIKPLTTPLSAEDQALDDMVEQLTNEGISAYDPIMLRILIEKFKNNKISGVSFKPLTVDKS